MSFANDTILKAWRRSGAKCECTRLTHNHPGGRCDRPLSFRDQNVGLIGGWAAQRIHPDFKEDLANCVILCWDCFQKLRAGV